MSVQKCSCDCKTIAVTVEETTVSVSVEVVPREPVVEVQIPGERGASAVDKPFDEDPTEIYLKARGTINGYNED